MAPNRPQTLIRLDVSVGSNATGHSPPDRPRSPLRPESRPDFNAHSRWFMLLASVTEPRSMAMQDQVNAAPAPKRVPWNKGKLTGAKPPLRPKHVWSIWTTLQIEGRARDLTMFNLVIDSELRGSNLAHERPLCAMSGPSITAQHANPLLELSRASRASPKVLPEFM